MVGDEDRGGGVDRARTLQEFQIQETVLNTSLKQEIINMDEGKKVFNFTDLQLKLRISFNYEYRYHP